MMMMMMMIVYRQNSIRITIDNGGLCGAALIPGTH